MSTVIQMTALRFVCVLGWGWGAWGAPKLSLWVNLWDCTNLSDVRGE